MYCKIYNLLLVLYKHLFVQWRIQFTTTVVIAYKTYIQQKFVSYRGWDLSCSKVLALTTSINNNITITVYCWLHLNLYNNCILLTASYSLSPSLSRIREAELIAHNRLFDNLIINSHMHINYFAYEQMLNACQTSR